MKLSDLCLGSLCLRDASGYDIKKLFEAAFSHFHSASYGSIYPALNQLAKAGLVEVHTEPGQGRPDRKVYRITEAGEAAFVETLGRADPTEQLKSEFQVLLFFAHQLSTERLSAILDQMESHYREKLGYMERIINDPCLSAGMRLGVEIGIASTSARLDVLRKHRQELLATHKEPPRCEPGLP